MALIEKITEDIKTAMKAKNRERLEALRGIKKELLEAQTAKGSGGSVDEAAELKILQKMVKQRKDSAALYKEQNREDLHDREMSEALVIEEYLPKQLSDEEIRATVKEIITETGAAGMQDMGKIMGLATKKLAGKAEGKKISEIVREQLK